MPAPLWSRPPPPPQGPRPATARPAPARFVEPFGSLSAEDSCKAATNFLVAVGFGDYAQRCAEAQLDLFALSGMSVAELQRELGVYPSKTTFALQEECAKLKRALHRSSAAVELPTWIPQLLPKPSSSPRSKRPTLGLKAEQQEDDRPKTALSEARPSSAAHKQDGDSSRPGTALTPRRGGDISPRELKLMMSGVAPTRGTIEDAKRLPNAEGAAAAEAAKRRVMRAISEREAVLAEMARVVPAPRSADGRARASLAIFGSVEAMAGRRRRLADLLGALRACGAAVVKAVARWKETLRHHFAYFAAVPDVQMAFFLPDSGNYLLKMCVDVSELLPVPATQDPLLLHWRGSRWTGAATLFEDRAPSASSDRLKAPAAPTCPSERAEQLERLARPQSPAAGRPKVEGVESVCALRFQPPGSASSCRGCCATCRRSPRCRATWTRSAPSTRAPTARTAWLRPREATSPRRRRSCSRRARGAACCTRRRRCCRWPAAASGWSATRAGGGSAPRCRRCSTAASTTTSCSAPSRRGSATASSPPPPRTCSSTTASARCAS
jgi:hypothetical protein